MAVLLSCGHELTGSLHDVEGAWWRVKERDGSQGWAYGTLCAACFRLRHAQREKPKELTG